MAVPVPAFMLKVTLTELPNVSRSKINLIIAIRMTKYLTLLT
jgi:hypothetical protein